MLKRQRAISPPPSNLEIPLVSDTPESHRRESKRRRVLPPSLDGQSRHAAFPAEDDGEEDDYDVDSSDSRNPPDVASSGSTTYNTEYQSANIFLHDLHALHRHRLLFSSPPSAFIRPGPFSPPVQEKSFLLPIVDLPRTVDKQELSGMQGFGIEEVDKVKERYEDTNRLRQSSVCRGPFNLMLHRMLGSLFLTRRKQLDPGPPQYDT
ncbi:hypothetical protein MSAN_02181300 [Mycena sanguinolenta]|uniref:Uncharacterized protein n=1 Tax=Mycena sanguinolenta TaxID=230812 RepID=A0A8H6XE21_9AGAR|nr:hypothetical protein MSAN_02181300 [Mycena sanguinolenta]